MNNDELRDDAKILALTMSLRALMQIMRDKDPKRVESIAALADHLIFESDIGTEEVRDAAALYRRKVVFEAVD